MAAPDDLDVAIAQRSFEAAVDLLDRAHTALFGKTISDSSFGPWSGAEARGKGAKAGESTACPLAGSGENGAASCPSLWPVARVPTRRCVTIGERLEEDPGGEERAPHCCPGGGVGAAIAAFPGSAKHGLSSLAPWARGLGASCSWGGEPCDGRHPHPGLGARQARDRYLKYWSRVVATDMKYGVKLPVRASLTATTAASDAVPRFRPGT